MSKSKSLPIIAGKFLKVPTPPPGKPEIVSVPPSATVYIVSLAVGHSFTDTMFI